MLRTIPFLGFLFFISLNNCYAQDEDLDLSQYKGKVIYLDFWASWCTPCRQSFPWMNQLHKDYADKGLVIVAVNLDEQRNEAAHFLKTNPAIFQVIYDQDGQLAEKYKVQGMPSSYIYDRAGNLVKAHIGFKNKDASETHDFIASLLNK